MFFRRKNQNQTTGTTATVAKNVTYRTPGNVAVYVPFLTMVKNDHLMIAGCTGSGKSVALNGIITSLLMKYSPYDAQFIFIDPKKVELFQYENIPHCVKYADNSKDFQLALKMAEIEMDRRFSIMKAMKQKEFSGSVLYVVIDELSDLMTTNKKECFASLVRLAQVGRAAKIRLIACTQNLLAKIIPTEFKVNFPVVLGLRTATKQQSNFLIHAAGLEDLPNPRTTGKGQGIIRDGSDLFPVEIYMYPEQVVKAVLNHWTTNKCIA